MAPDILVVDDNEQNLKSVTELLADLGASLVCARSGNEALLKLLTHEYAVILLDVQMPGMDGFETASLIRQRDRNRHTPIIFVTAFDRSEQSIRTGYERGAVDFLFKPIIPEILRSKVAFFLELYRKTEEARQQAELLRAAEKRDHERSLAETRQKYERALLDAEMKRERKVAETLKARADELSRLLEENERAQWVLKKSNDRLQLLADVAGALLSHADVDAHVPALLGRLAAHLELDAYLGFRREATGAIVRLGARGGAVNALLERLDAGEALIPETRATQLVDTATLPDSAALAATRPMQWVVAPIASPDRSLGAILCGTAPSRTLTQAELSLVQLFADQVASALERAQLIHELREQDRRKNEFLAMLGHELRNPLAPIRNSLELFRRRSSGDAIYDRAVAATERQVAHITRLVDDLLDVSRITRGKVQLKKALVDIAGVVDQAVHASEPLIQQRQHRLSVRLAEGPAWVDGDQSRLTQIVANLLQNAAKYTEPGGAIHLDVQRVEGELVLIVKDNGVGLRPETIERIFEPFIQEDSSPDRSLGGLGLGLTLVKTLTEMHGGTVTAFSEGPGQGSEFTVRLPLAEAGPQPSEPPLEPARTERPEPLKILLAEDNADIRTTLRDLLELHGHSVVEAADGINAVEVALAERPHIALVDIGLPGFDGYRVAELLRAAVGTADTRLVAVTGYGTEDARRRAKEAGFHAHLVKPIALEDLNQILRQLT